MKITNDEEFNKAFDTASALITRHITLHGKDSGWNEKCDPEELNQGIAGMQTLVEYRPDHWPAYWLIGKAYQAMEDKEKAYEAFKAAYNLNPDQADVAREFSISCIDTGRKEEAVNIARKSIENNPQDAGLYANLALAEILAGNVDESLATINKSLSLNPEDNISQYLFKVLSEIKEGKRPLPKNQADLLS